MTAALQPRPAEQVVKYQVAGKEIELRPSHIKRYLVSGKADAVQDYELMLFIGMCKSHGLDPWAKDAYLIKYSEKSPASIVVGKYAFAKRANNHPAYAGCKAGIVIRNQGGLEYRDGSLLLPGEDLVGGWAEVYRKDRQHPDRAEVALCEYIGKKPVYRNGQRTSEFEVTEMWATKPATMIRKVAYVHAMREAFPDFFANMYIAEEMPYHEPPTERRTATEEVTDLLKPKALPQPPAEPMPTIIESDLKVPTLVDVRANDNSAKQPAGRNPKTRKKQAGLDLHASHDCKVPLYKAKERFGDAAVAELLRFHGLSESLAGDEDGVKTLVEKALCYESNPPAEQDDPLFEAWMVAVGG